MQVPLLSKEVFLLTKYLTDNITVMSKVAITLVKSSIKRPKVQKATLTALGLTKMHRTVEKELNPAIQGMINVVKHMVKVEQI